MRTALVIGLMLVVSTPAVADEPKTLKLEKTIPIEGVVGRYDHMALDAKGDRLLVANLSNDSLDVIDLKAGKLVKQVPGQKKIQGVAYAPDLDRIFVGNGVDGECRAFDGKSFELIGAVKLPDADNVRYHAAKGLVYVGHAESSLTAIDPKTLAVKAAVKLPGPPEAFQIDAAGNRIFVNTLRPAMVAVVDLDKNEVTAKYAITKADANYPLALDPAGKRVFVGCRKPPKVVVLDADTGKELSDADIPGDTDDLFFDAKRKRLYVCCGEGVLAVLEDGGEKGFKLVEKVATRKLTRTGLYDPASDRLFVILPRTDDKTPPELRVYRPAD
jgi:DNA-binding beta-propeller fold protein YncE